MTDLQLAREKQAAFDDWKGGAAKELAIDLSVTVLTTGFWPTYKARARAGRRAGGRAGRRAGGRRGSTLPMERGRAAAAPRSARAPPAGRARFDKALGLACAWQSGRQAGQGRVFSHWRAGRSPGRARACKDGARAGAGGGPGAAAGDGRGRGAVQGVRPPPPLAWLRPWAPAAGRNPHAAPPLQASCGQAHVDRQRSALAGQPSPARRAGARGRSKLRAQRANARAEEASCARAQEWYEASTKHRKLTWIYALGTCNLKANFDARPVELIMATFQAALLLLFNNRARAPARLA